MKKILKTSMILFLAFLFSSCVFAGSPVASGDATMKLVENNVCSMTFGKYGTFEKKMTKIDTTNKTIDIQLTATNNQDKIKDETKTEEVIKAGEVVFLIDGSRSMSVNEAEQGSSNENKNETDQTATKKSRGEVVLESAQKLADKLFEAKSDIKIGVVEFATSTDTSKRGTDDDAAARTNGLASSKDDVTKALQAVKESKMGSQTDLEVGLKKAEEMLNTTKTDNKQKYIIVFTDAIPNVASGVVPEVYSDEEKAQGYQGFKSAYDDKVFVPTKNELTSLANKGITVMSLLINMKDEEIQISTEKPKPTYKEVANRIFGTEADPTAGPVYYVTDNDVESTVTDKIFTDLKETKTITVTPENKYELTDIVIKDYFPKNIIDNFGFALLTKPEIGEVTATVDKSDNSITWKISKLEPGQTANFSYRLKLNNQFDSEIVGINLPTNKNVTIDYKENGKQGPQVQNDKCPIVALDVEAKKDIPQTGSNTWLIVSALVIVAGAIATASFINYRKNM